MVKGVSDVDVYFRYTGNGNSQSALATLKKCLIDGYLSTDIMQGTSKDFLGLEPVKLGDFGGITLLTFQN